MFRTSLGSAGMWAACVVMAVVAPGCGVFQSAGVEDAKVDMEPYAPPEIDLATATAIRESITRAAGSVVVVNFWATWCPPCVKEIPELNRFYIDFAEKGVTYLSFSSDEPSTLEDRVRPFVNSYEIPYPVHVINVADSTKLDAALTVEWDGKVPTTYVFAPDGSLARRWDGQVTYDELAEVVQALGAGPGGSGRVRMRGYLDGRLSS